MCVPLLAPLVCTYQMLARVFLSILYAVEDVIRLVIHVVHSYVSTVLHAISYIPACVVYCCVKQYYCCCYTSTFKPDHGYASCSVCYCFLMTSMVLALFIILYYTYWIEDFLQEIGIETPKNIFGKEDRYGKRLWPEVEYKFNNNTYNVQEEEEEKKFHKYARVAAIVLQSNLEKDEEVKNKQEPSNASLIVKNDEVITNTAIQGRDNFTLRTNFEEDFISTSEILTTPVMFVATLHIFSDFVTDSTNESIENVTDLR